MEHIQRQDAQTTPETEVQLPFGHSLGVEIELPDVVNRKLMTSGSEGDG